MSEEIHNFLKKQTTIKPQSNTLDIYLKNHQRPTKNTVKNSPIYIDEDLEEDGDVLAEIKTTRESQNEQESNVQESGEKSENEQESESEDDSPSALKIILTKQMAATNQIQKKKSTVTAIALKHKAKFVRSSEGVKKKRRNKPGTVALREIRKYQKSTALLIKKTPFKRLVRQITQEGLKREVMFKKEAIAALHECAEDYLTDIMKQGMEFVVHAKRKTIQPEDIKLAQTVIKRWLK